ncbi:HlyD family secretion protein [Mesorhizobium mediterraneum]|uniref:HlyD family secretion protein n=1 Tax=Mesorhizobium mediterraneum TaxID=43617 RepID=UPI00177DA4F2|nr:HlyD family secretion protein [Mesorhizobium mediterraneum]
MDAPTTERPRRDLVVESPPLASEGSEAAPDIAAKGKQNSRSRLRMALMAGGIVAVAAGSAYFWFTGGRYASTDDSYVRAAEVAVSSDVSGIVTEVDVKEGQEVKAGDVLFRIDPRQYRNALDNAKATLANAALDIDSTKANYKQLLSDIAAQRDVVDNDQVTLDRYSTLVKDQLTITKAQFDQARYTLEADKNKLEALQEQAQTVLAKLAGNPDIPTEQHPEYLQAKAEVDEAQRQLNDTTVRAPFSGVVTRVDSLQPGLFVVAQTAGLTDQGAVGLVSTDNVWVEAEMKETDLTLVKPRDHVDVTLDTYPGHVWSGSVDTISPAGASDFSILPAQNASGNWVKVVQRFLVRIRIDRKPGNPVLRSGMSAEVAIDTGHRRTLSDLF